MSLSTSLSNEFDTTSLEINNSNNRNDPRESDDINDFTVTLENTGEVLHSIGLGEPAVFPSEMESLMMISKIGIYLTEQRKR